MRNMLTQYYKAQTSFEVEMVKTEFMTHNLNQAYTEPDYSDDTQILLAINNNYYNLDVNETIAAYNYSKFNAKLPFNC